MLNLGQLNTINAYMEHGQFEAMDEYLSQVYVGHKVGQFEPQVSDDCELKILIIRNDYRPIYNDSYIALREIDGMDLKYGEILTNKRTNDMYVVNEPDNITPTVFTNGESVTKFLKSVRNWICPLDNGGLQNIDTGDILIRLGRKTHA